MFNNKPPFFIAIVLSIAILAIATSTHWQLHDMQERRLSDSLNTILDGSHQAVKIWQRSHRSTIEGLARDPIVQSLTTQLLGDQSVSTRNLLRHEFINHLKHLHPDYQLVQNKNSGFILVAVSGKIIASSQISLFDKMLSGPQNRRALSEILTGSTQFSLPHKSDIPLYDKHGQLNIGVPTMMVGSAVRDANNTIVAALFIRIDVRAEFAPIFQNSRLGSSGETYAFNRSGFMITDSRFTRQLQEIGLLNKQEDAVLNIKITDPGHNLLANLEPSLVPDVQALTFMAGRATKKNDGLKVDGYRDYRGVLVAGSWLWDHELDLGIAAEIDLDEATQMYTRSWMTIWGLTLVTLIGLNSLLWLHVRYRQRLKIVSQQQQAILDNTSSLIYIVDRSSRLLLINNACKKAFEDNGYNNSYNSVPRRQAPDAIADTLERKSEEVLNTKQPVEFELSIPLKTGLSRYLAVKFPMWDEHGHIYAIGAIATDITSRRKAEVELQERERFLHSLMSNLHGLVYRTNAPDNESTHYISQGCLPLTGFSPADFLGAEQAQGQNEAAKRLSQLVADEDRELYRETKTTALALRRNFELEYRITTAQGEEKWVWERGKGFYNERNQLEAIEGFITDISDRKAIDRELSAHRKNLARLIKDQTRELEHERSRLNAVILNAADGICTFDARGNITLFSPAAQTITGYRLDEVLGKPFTHMLPARFKAEYEDDFLTRLYGSDHSNISKRLELELCKKNGEIVTVEMALSKNFIDGEMWFTAIIREKNDDRIIVEQ